MYFVSSSGILVYKSHCECTGNEQVSVYIAPESCETEFHKHHDHAEDGAEICVNEAECHDCSSHEKECGCDAPLVSFFKLMNQLIEDETLYFNVNQLPVNFALVDDLVVVLQPDKPVSKVFFYTDPPPTVKSSTDFLIQIQQLKIPFIA